MEMTGVETAEIVVPTVVLRWARLEVEEDSRMREDLTDSASDALDADIRTTTDGQLAESYVSLISSVLIPDS